jgi:hypothetical protein
VRKIFQFATALAATCVTSVTCSAAIVTIGASRDATIFENNVNNGSGGGNGLFAGTNGAGNSPRRALIGFDVAGSIPAGSLLEDVHLTLTLGQFPNVGAVATSTIGLHRLAADWGEGTTQQQIPSNDTFGGLGQGAAATEGDVTWNARFFSASAPSPWTAPGGDVAATVSASTVVTRTLTPPIRRTQRRALISDVRGWLDNPSSNFGWMLVSADEVTPATFRGFYSRQTATAAFRPQLSVTFALAGDFDGNDVVNALDLANWKTGFGTSAGATHAQGDADADGDVDGDDFLIWQRQLGMSALASPSTAPTPEPTAGVLGGIAALSLRVVARRRRIVAAPSSYRSRT